MPTGKKKKDTIAQAMVAKRWKKATPHERRAVGKQLAAARRKARRKRQRDAS
jgi:predicted Fe-S protein YdhL (DUF1289 family)